uniref:Uncharacterized protein n=1 Tax=Desulfovibrio sp. U5L TaxID=596152 RepID=I2PWX0_9BACT
MDIKSSDLIDLKDEIIASFRPIEQLFKIMDKSSTDVFGELIRCHGEIGTVLCNNFRQNIDCILKKLSTQKIND